LRKDDEGKEALGVGSVRQFDPGKVFFAALSFQDHVALLLSVFRVHQVSGSAKRVVLDDVNRVDLSVANNDFNISIEPSGQNCGKLIRNVLELKVSRQFLSLI